MNVLKCLHYYLLFCGIFFCSVKIAQATDETPVAIPSEQTNITKNEEPIFKPNFEFRIKPQGLLYSVWGAGLEYKIFKHTTLGGRFFMFDGNEGKSDISVYQYALGLTQFIGGDAFENAWYLEAGIGGIMITNSRLVDPKDYEGAYHGGFAKVGAGRYWRFLKHFSASIGGALSQVFGPDTLEVRSPTNSTIDLEPPVSRRIRPYIEMTIGFLF